MLLDFIDSIFYFPCCISVARKSISYLLCWFLVFWLKIICLLIYVGFISVLLFCFDTVMLAVDFSFSLKKNGVFLLLCCKQSIYFCSVMFHQMIGRFIWSIDLLWLRNLCLLRSFTSDMICPEYEFIKYQLISKMIHKPKNNSFCAP
jgi:hypothetical protein